MTLIRIGSCVSMACRLLSVSASASSTWKPVSVRSVATLLAGASVSFFSCIAFVCAVSACWSCWVSIALALKCSLAFSINVAVSSLLRTASPRLLCLPLAFFAVSSTPQGLHRLRISACTPLCSVRTAVHKATADSSHSEASFDRISAREFIVMSSLPGDASHVDPSNAGAMCSVAASGLAAESLDRSGGAFPGSCMVDSASAGVPSVCSVAGRVAVVRFLEVPSWFCGLFPKVGSTKAMAVHARFIRSACIDIAVKIRHSIC